RIARRARDRRDDGALRAEQPIQERRLANVGPTDDRKSDLARRGFGINYLCLLIEMCDERVEQIADAVTVFGGDGDDLIETELIKLARVGFEARGVRFVRGDEHGLACAAQQAR